MCGGGAAARSAARSSVQALSFARGFEAQGVLVRMIIRIAGDVYHFIEVRVFATVVTCDVLLRVCHRRR